MADRFQPRLECLKNLLLGQIGELLAKALEVAESVLVDDADEAEEFEQRVLQRRGREQKLVAFLQRQLERVGDDVGRLVDVAQPMGFVDDDEVPWRRSDIGRLAARKLIGADDDGVLHLERLKIPLFDCLVVGLRFQYPARQEELFGQFLMPLLAQIGRHDDENTPLPLRPSLRKDKTRLDGLAQANLVGQQRALRKRRVESEQRRVHLVRIQIHLRAGNRAGELLHAVRRAALGQLVGEVLGVVGG